MNRFATLLLVVLTSCKQIEPSCAVTQLPAESFLVPGQLMKTNVGLLERCTVADNQLFHLPDQVAIKLFDPDGIPYPFHSSAPMQSESTVSGTFRKFNNTALVEFTPDRRGTWHVSAKFEPGLGQVEIDFEAVELRPDAGVRTIAWQSPSNCSNFALTDLGKLVCIRRSPSGQHDLVTQNEQNLVGDAFALDRNSLWLAANGRIDRLVQDGGVFERTHQFDAPNVGADQMDAFNGDLWAIAGTGSQSAVLLHAHLESDGGLSIERRTFPQFHAQGVKARPDGVLLYGFRINPEPAPGSKGGGRMIFLPTDGGALERPVPATAPIIGTDGAQTVWSFNGASLFATRPSSANASQASIALPGLNLIGFGSSSPLSPYALVMAASSLNTQVRPPYVVPRFDGTSIILESYDPGPDYAIDSATPTHVFARSVDGKSLKIFDR